MTEVTLLEPEKSDRFQNLLDSVFKFRENLDTAINSIASTPALGEGQKGFLSGLIAARDELVTTVEA